MKRIIMISIFLFAGMVFFYVNSQNVDNRDMKNTKTEQITLGGGCFWCIEAVFEKVEGVEKVISGYSGGNTQDPSYKEVCSGTTGHAEVCQITYHPDKISFADILEIFFRTHDPTTMNRQGNDVGTQYRSVIFYHTEEQKQFAEKYISSLNMEGIWKKPIVTEIIKLDTFYRAEDYHQNYFRNNPDKPYCTFVVAPKVRKFEMNFKSVLK